MGPILLVLARKIPRLRMATFQKLSCAAPDFTIRPHFREVGTRKIKRLLVVCAGIVTREPYR